MADVFVSYSRKDRGRVAEVADGLDRSGFSLWWDRNLRSGGDYGLVIEREIEAARGVVVAWSATARQSLWVRAEANEALDSGKLVQISLDETRLPLPFTMLHTLDFSSWRGAREGAPWSDLESRLLRLRAGETIDDAGPEQAQAVPGQDARLQGPALQGLGRTALIGSAAIALAAGIALATGMAAMGRLSSALFGGIAGFGVAAAAILLALSAFVLARTAAASRR
jgi:hypothetical protein